MALDLEQTIMVTGGAGFIGSALIRKLVSAGYMVANVDKLTYAGNLDNLTPVSDAPNYEFFKIDICDSNAIRDMLSEFRPKYVFHLAAESHVDRSIDSSDEFIDTNIIGTYNLVKCLVDYRDSDASRLARYIHVSTDEVYGSIDAPGLFNEQSNFNPSSPYSASKASSDLIVSAWIKSFKLPAIVTNCSNNYGPYQFPEKLIPHVYMCLSRNEPIPVYGDGQNTRDWLHVNDHVDALISVMESGVIGEKYNIGGNCEVKNLDLVKNICRIFDGMKGQKLGTSDRLISFVRDRPAHDLRYAVDSTKIQDALGWRPKMTLDAGLSDTIKWYSENLAWTQKVLGTSYRHKRIGLGSNECTK